MSFSVRKDMELLNKILNWDGVRKANFSVNGVDWTDEDLKKADLSDDEIIKFRKNLEDCQKTAKERNTDGITERLIEASSRVASYGDIVFILNPETGIYEVGTKARQRLAYNVYGDIKKDVMSFAMFDYKSRKRELTSLKTRFIRVGAKYFSIYEGKMVDEAPEEFRTFAISRDVHYEPIDFKDCKSRLILDMKKYFGESNLQYALLNIAYNLMDLRTDKVALIIVGEQRSGKTTFGKVLKLIGLAPNVNLEGDFENNSKFADNLSNVLGIYPCIIADDVESLNWQRLKNSVSGESMSVEPKGEQKFTVPCRAMTIITTNTTPRCALDGMVDKFVILETKESFRHEQNSNYLEEIEAENGFDEFINLILTFAHEMTAKPWTPLMMPEDLKETNDESMRDNLYHSMFFNEWDRDNNNWVSSENAYTKYLIYANFGTSYEYISREVQSSKGKPTARPDGLSGVSRRNFITSAKNNGIEWKVVHGNKIMFKGKAPTRDVPDDAVLGDSNFFVEKVLDVATGIDQIRGVTYTG